MAMNINLSGKNALVCGSSRGIGKQTALTLAQLGANITLMSRSKDKLEVVLQELDTSLGQVHQYITADFSNSDDLQQKVSNLCQKTPIHILINNTGGPAAGPVQSATKDQFLSAFHNHLICNQILAQTVLEGMKADHYGRIINVISTSVKQPLNGLGVSNTIRGAVANWSKTLANELGPFGITVNNVLPGATLTDRLSEIIEAKAHKTQKTQDDISKGMQAIIPMQRFAQLQEVANAIAFLASPAASYITGINLPVDGGRTKSL